jgi:hypothetical protein
MLVVSDRAPALPRFRASALPRSSGSALSDLQSESKYLLDFKSERAKGSKRADVNDKNSIIIFTFAIPHHICIC